MFNINKFKYNLNLSLTFIIVTLIFSSCKIDSNNLNDNYTITNIYKENLLPHIDSLLHRKSDIQNNKGSLSFLNDKCGVKSLELGINIDSVDWEPYNVKSYTRDYNEDYWIIDTISSVKKIYNCIRKWSFENSPNFGGGKIESLSLYFLDGILSKMNISIIDRSTLINVKKDFWSNSLQYFPTEYENFTPTPDFTLNDDLFNLLKINYGIPNKTSRNINNKTKKGIISFFEENYSLFLNSKNHDGIKDNYYNLSNWSYRNVELEYEEYLLHYTQENYPAFYKQKELILNIKQSQSLTFRYKGIETDIEEAYNYKNNQENNLKKENETRRLNSLSEEL